MPEESNPDFVLSLARGLKVIEAFHEGAGGLTVSDVAARTGLSRASVRRLLITLELLGYAEHSGASYKLRSRVLRLGFSYLSSDSLPSLAIPILEHVTAVIHESCSLSVLDEDQIVYLARSPSRRVMSVALSVGSRLPAYCTSMGRVLLAALEPRELAAYLSRVQLKALTPKTITAKRALTRAIAEARSRDYALVDEELEIGLRSIAVPVRTRTDRVIASMNTGVHAARVSRDVMIRRFLPVLRENARLLGQMVA